MQPPEKNKKVSRACNTCRLKRKKCDGLEPCIFCTETKVECSYSREPRRRGPPSGYLRFTETRVALLETLLGLFIQTSGPESAHMLYDAARKLTEESTTHTQDVWDSYKQSWTDSNASRAVHELATVFAPFSPAENQTPTTKALLPLTGTSRPPPPPPPRSLSPPPPGTFLYINESFERTHHEPISSPHNEVHDMHDMTRDEVHDMPDMGQNEGHDMPDMGRDERQAYELEPMPEISQMDLGLHTDLHPDLPMPMFLPSPPADPATPSAYPGAYWRTAALASPTFASLPLPLSPTMAGLSAYFTPSTAPTTTPADLPPPNVRATLLATYRTAVHPSLPILSPAQCTSLSDTHTPMLLLALCAYTARLAPPAASSTRVAADLWYESASTLLNATLRRRSVQIDAVQTLLLLALRDHGRGRDAMAWRGIGAAVRVAVELGLDHVEPEARDAEATKEREWERGLWGVATMLDLFLSIQTGRAPASAEALRPLAPQPLALTVSSSSSTLPSPSPSAASPMNLLTNSNPSSHVNQDAGDDAEDTDTETALFAQTRALVRIVARVHFSVGLGYELLSKFGSTSSVNNAVNGSNDDPLRSLLLAELAAWHRSLPQRFRVALGGDRVPCAVLEAHMLYQVGIGMLGRARGGSEYSSTSILGSLTNGGGYTGFPDTDDAASTFNVLLDKYRPSLGVAGPHVVWLVFAAARTCIAGGRAPAKAPRTSLLGYGMGMGGTQGQHGSARALQTQLYLLNCREALAGMGGTWELARRCAHTLERLMDGDAASSSGSGSGVPGTSSVGKRKRDHDERERDSRGERKRRDMDDCEGEPFRQQAHYGQTRAFGGWGALEVEPFDFDVAEWGPELDGMGMGSGVGGGAGQWEGTCDEMPWGRGGLGGSVNALRGGSGGGSGFGLGLGLFDASPGPGG
ncbi:hypothetical protein C8R43DRAFT_940827 [Mycena crocata]|nr:hypothetical protein C8R43DRAFT_940827 [Mycena crocata]